MSEETFIGPLTELETLQADIKADFTEDYGQYSTELRNDKTIFDIHIDTESDPQVLSKYKIFLEHIKESIRSFINVDDESFKHILRENKGNLSSLLINENPQLFPIEGINIADKSEIDKFHKSLIDPYFTQPVKPVTLPYIPIYEGIKYKHNELKKQNDVYWDDNSVVKGVKIDLNVLYIVKMYQILLQLEKKCYTGHDYKDINLIFYIQLQTILKSLLDKFESNLSDENKDEIIAILKSPLTEGKTIKDIYIQLLQYLNGNLISICDDFSKDISNQIKWGLEYSKEKKEYLNETSEFLRANTEELNLLNFNLKPKDNIIIPKVGTPLVKSAPNVELKDSVFFKDVNNMTISNKYKQLQLGFHEELEKFKNNLFINKPYNSNPDLWKYKDINRNETNTCYNVEWSISNNRRMIWEILKANENKDSLLFPIRFHGTNRLQGILVRDDDSYTYKYGTMTLNNLFGTTTTYLGCSMCFYKLGDFNILRGFFYFKKDNSYIRLNNRFLNNIKLPYFFIENNITYEELTQLYNLKDSLSFYKKERDDKTIYIARNTHPRINELNPSYYIRQEFIRTEQYDQNSFKFEKYNWKGGGSRKHKLKFNLQKNVILIDKISGIYYNKYDNISMQFYNKYKFGKNFIMYSTYLYKYYFSGETYLILSKLNINKLSNFLKFKPQTHLYFRYNEMLIKYLGKKKYTSFSFIGQYIDHTFLEYLKFNNYDIKKLYYILIKKNNEKELSKELNILEFLKPMYELPYENYTKTDFIVYSIYDILPDIYMNLHFQNDINLFIGLLYGLKFTNSGGTFILNISHINNKNQADVYLIAKQYFEQSHLYYPEVCNLFKNSGAYAIFIGFKGIPEKDYKGLLDILEGIKKEYPNGIEDLNIYEPEIREKYMITRPITKRRKYIYGYLDTDLEKDAELYKDIIEFNDSRYIKQSKFMEDIYKLSQLPKESLPIVPTPHQINYSILYCKKWGIEYNEFFDKNKNVVGKVATQILNEMYGLHQPIIFEFKTPNQYYLLPKPSLKSIKSIKSSFKHKFKLSKSKKKTKKFEKFKKNLNIKGGSKSKKKAHKSKRFKSVREALDYFEFEEYKNLFSKKSNIKIFKIDVSLSEHLLESNNRYNQDILSYESRFSEHKKENKKTINKFETIKSKFDYYSTSQKSKSTIPNILQKIMKNKNINTEWTVLFEILYELDIIKDNLFLINLVYFNQDKDNNKDKDKDNVNSEIECMRYFIAKYRSNPVLKLKYVNQSQNNGDIIDLCESLYMESIHNKSETLILNTNVNTNNMKDLFCSLATSLMTLPKNGTMIFKMQLPLNNALILNMIYIMYQYFDTFTFYKPIQNSYNTEFFIVGKNFLTIPKQISIELLYIIDNYDTIDADTLDLFQDTYPESFVQQLSYINKILVDKHNFIIDKQLYYFDNYEYLDKKFTELAPQFIKEKNIEWLRRYKIKK